MLKNITDLKHSVEDAIKNYSEKIDLTNYSSTNLTITNSQLNDDLMNQIGLALKRR